MTKQIITKIPKIPTRKTGKDVNCKTCNSSFYVPKWRLKINVHHFCSRVCYLSDHKEEFIYVKCKGCNKKVKVNAKQKRALQDKIYCNDNCRSKKNRVLKCVNCKVDFCAFEYRKANNLKGFTIARTIKKTCSSKCLNEFYRNDQSRKDKISKATSGENHPNYVNGASYNSRVRYTDIKENFGAIDKRKVFNLFNNKCFKCKSTDSLSIDHHLPFSRGGLLTFSNCVILCRSCNSSKNAKKPEDFYSEKELKKLRLLGIDSNSLFSQRY